MNTIEVFGLSYILYLAVMAVLIGFAVYILVLVIIFLRLRIAEQRRSQPTKGEARE